MTRSEDEPPVAAQRLAAFIGAWKVEGTLTAEGSPATVSGTWSFRSAGNGWGVHGSLRTEIEGMGAFDESELIGFDATEDVIHLFSMNKFAVRDHRGGWVDETTLSVEYTGMLEGKQVTEQIMIEFIGADHIRGAVTEQVDGAVVITTDLSMERI